MVSLILVSHSSMIAEGVREMALQMTGPKISIAACGGTAEGTLGTDALKLGSLIEELICEDGILVLADLGSAVLTAEQVIEFLDEDQQKLISIANAPFVEGAIMAAVEASIGSSLEKVLEAAEGASSLKKI